MTSIMKETRDALKVVAPRCANVWAYNDARKYGRRVKLFKKLSRQQSRSLQALLQARNPKYNVKVYNWKWWNWHRCNDNVVTCIRFEKI